MQTPMGIKPETARSAGGHLAQGAMGAPSASKEQSSLGLHCLHIDISVGISKVNIVKIKKKF